MGDEKRVQLTLGVKTDGSDKAVADLDKIAKEYADIARLTGSVGSSLRLATIEADRFGATDDDIRKLSKLYNEYRQTVEAATDDTEALADAQKDVVANAPGGEGGDSGGNGSGGNFLQRAGSGIRSLPSIQIPGTGIGTDAVGNILRVTGALGGMTDKLGPLAVSLGLAKVATETTAVAEGGAAAASTALTLALGPIAIVGAVIVGTIGLLGLAISSTSKEAERNTKINEELAAQYKATDKVFEEVINGLTSDQAAKNIEEEKKRVEEAGKEIAQIEEENARVRAEIIEKSAGGVIDADIAMSRGTDGFGKRAEREKELTQQMADSTANIEKFTEAMNDGSTAANDAAESEKKLAEERTKATLDSAEAAGKELAAEQKALASTEEQNNKRLEAIGNEKDVLQTQIDVLAASGDTSEEVTAKIASLTGQLGALGKESQFITDVALEASHAADAEKKAKKDAEDAAKKAEQAQIAYTKAVQSANLTYKNAVQDIGTRLGQALSDNATKYNRDLVNIATKYKQDEYDLEIKAGRAERDAQQDQLNDLVNLRKDANKEEQQALQDGDFKALFLARQKNAETLQQEQVTIDQSKAKREQSARDAQEDLLRSAQRQRQARILSYQQQDTDTRTAAARDLQQAALTRKRALQIASEGQNAELAMRANFWNAAIAQTANAQNQMLKIMQGGAQGRGPNQSNSPYAGGFPSSFTAAVRK